MTYDEVKAETQARQFPTTASWFEFLAAIGWTSEQLRNAANERRAAKGEKPLRPCVQCGKHHDTLAIAEACASAKRDEPLLCYQCVNCELTGLPCLFYYPRAK